MTDQSQTSSQYRLWGGRFEKEPDPLASRFGRSIHFDRRLWRADIRASMAHAKSLSKIGVFSTEELQLVISAFETILSEGTDFGPKGLNLEAEDIHSEIERLLKEKVGAVGSKVHTGRSRNDQVATATRLYVRDEIDRILALFRNLQKTIVATAEKHLDTVLPGLTHTQHAQPVTLAHHLMAYFFMFARDRERLTELRARVNTLPLGSGALAGSAFAVDRAAVAKELGFERISENSLDAVSDRDFVVELLSMASITLLHLSRMAEEFVLWSTPEFGFIELDDSVTTGSSMMPQKKNPDCAELVRGKVGRVVGDLTAMLVTLKALPLAYNRDLQEDKERLFDGIDTLKDCIEITTVMLESVKFKVQRMRASVDCDYSNATDVADECVRKGRSFREAHETVGRLVRYAIEQKKGLEELSLDEFREFDERFDESILKVVKPEAVIAQRSIVGGTARGSVLAQIERAKTLI